MKIEYNYDKSIGPIIFFTFTNKKIGFCLCHKKKERSISFFGLERFLCSRCIGILLGYIFGLVLNLFIIFRIEFSILFIVPLVLDGVTQLFGYRESNNLLRVLTGILFGVGIVNLFCYLAKFY